MTEQRARELLRRIKRTSEMSAGLMRDKKRTGGWAGSEGTAQQFDRLAQYAAEATTALSTPFAESAKSPSDSVSEAAERLLEFRVGELPSQGWLRDNDASRLALAELSAALQSIKDQGNG